MTANDLIVRLRLYGFHELSKDHFCRYPGDPKPYDMLVHYHPYRDLAGGQFDVGLDGSTNENTSRWDSYYERITADEAHDLVVHHLTTTPPDD